MDSTASPRRFPLYGLVGAGLLIVSSALLYFEIEPFETWFFVFAWWSYLLVADALVFRLRGHSRIKSEPRSFLTLFPLSVFFWLLFEALNLRLMNWRYLGVPWNTSLRWTGYLLSFSTVLPGLFETRDLLEALGLFQKRIFAIIQISAVWLWVSLGLGFFCLALPLVWPNVFFPLVWVAFIFLLDPVLYLLGGPSLLRQWESVGLKEVYLLMASGLVCGGLWELWNVWAGAKWVYDIPYLGFARIGEMPLLGFLGFPPFAVECYCLYHTFLLFWKRGPVWSRFTAAAVMALFVIVLFQAVDANTVWQFQP